MTGEDYPAIAAHVAEHAPRARLLEHLTAEADAEVHRIWLDGADVLHARPQDPAAPSGAWTLEREPARRALEWIRDALRGVLERVADPALYAQASPGRQVQDQDALEEMYAVELAAITSLAAGVAQDPRTVDQVIQGQIAAARAEAGRLAGLRVYHIRAAFEEGGRGWQTRAADALGLDRSTLSNLLAGERERRRRRDEAAREAREQAD